MSPTRRLQLVQRVTEEKQRRLAQRLAQSRGRLAQCEAKLAELSSFHAGYLRDFAGRAAGGIGGAGLREFHAFLAKLQEAIRQQEDIVRKARADSESEQLSWQGAAQRSRIVDKVVERRQAGELKARAAREQGESDERGQRITRRLDTGGN